jgi:hypothetical protein
VQDVSIYIRLDEVIMSNRFVNMVVDGINRLDTREAVTVAFFCVVAAITSAGLCYTIVRNFGASNDVDRSSETRQDHR